MFDEFNNYTPDYSAPAFEPPPAFDPFELTFDVPEVPHEDPMAYIPPPMVDAYAFDATALNACIGVAMNEIARMQHP